MLHLLITIASASCCKTDSWMFVKYNQISMTIDMIKYVEKIHFHQLKCISYLLMSLEVLFLSLEFIKESSSLFTFADNYWQERVSSSSFLFIFIFWDSSNWHAIYDTLKSLWRLRTCCSSSLHYVTALSFLSSSIALCTKIISSLSPSFNIYYILMLNSFRNIE
jgi:hypothetical protein